MSCSISLVQPILISTASFELKARRFHNVPATFSFNSLESGRVKCWSLVVPQGAAAIFATMVIPLILRVLDKVHGTVRLLFSLQQF